MLQEELEQRLLNEFGCSRSAANAISEKAIMLKDEVESDPDNWDSLTEIDMDYIVSKLDMAPEQLSATAKWNWWVNVMNLHKLEQDYEIN